MHCTQGPPGTGKSYTGVVLIAALDLMRQAAISDGQPVGPIVALSYKNHALDEIMSDVISLPQFSGASRPGSLIRCGKPDSFKLEAFKESTSPSEIHWEGQLNERLGALRRARDFGNDLHDLGAHTSTGAPGVLTSSDRARALVSW